MNTTKIESLAVDISNLKLIGFVLFFLMLGVSSLQARTTNPTNVEETQSLSSVDKDLYTYEITSAFISTWKAVQIRDHAVIQVISTNEFLVALGITEELRKFVDEPIMVSHGYEDGKVVYTIKIGRFANIDEASKYHDMLR